MDSGLTFVEQAITQAFAQPPDPPTGSALAGSTPSMVTLSWAAPAFDGYGPIDSYSVYLSQQGVPQANFSATTNLTQYTFVYLWGSTNYDFKVAAHNVAGLGAYSSVVTVITQPTTAPGPPTAAPGTGTARTVTVSWVSPLETGGLPINGFYVTLTTPSGSTTAYTPLNQYTFTGLAPGTTYQFSVVAFNTQGNSTVYTGQESTIGEDPRCVCLVVFSF